MGTKAVWQVGSRGAASWAMDQWDSMADACWELEALYTLKYRE